MTNYVFTLLDVSNIIVDLSSTCLAAAICALLLSSLRSFCLSPVRCASSTISAPNWLKAFTNSVKLFTDSKRSRLWDTYNDGRLSRSKNHQLNCHTLSLASRSCLTTTISANSNTLVTAPNRHLAALTNAVRSANTSISSSVSSHILSIAPPETQTALNNGKNSQDYYIKNEHPTPLNHICRRWLWI